MSDPKGQERQCTPKSQKVTKTWIKLFSHFVLLSKYSQRLNFELRFALFPMVLGLYNWQKMEYFELQPRQQISKKTLFWWPWRDDAIRLIQRSNSTRQKNEKGIFYLYAWKLIQDEKRNVSEFIIYFCFRILKIDYFVWNIECKEEF